jgi:hypothetical protein
MICALRNKRRSVSGSSLAFSRSKTAGMLGPPSDSYLRGGGTENGNHGIADVAILAKGQRQ